MSNLTNILEENLNMFLNKNIEIVQEGFICSHYIINNLIYDIEYEILSISDNKYQIYLRLNLNQIYKIESTHTELKLYLDNDSSIFIKKLIR